MSNLEKLCIQCNEIKSLNDGYYHFGAGGIYCTKLCKICHNSKRNQYGHKSKAIYKNKPNGFQKLPIEIQNKIIMELYYYEKFKSDQGWDFKFAKVFKQYSVQYQTLMLWYKKGKIPKYTETIVSQVDHGDDGSQSVSEGSYALLSAY